MKILVVESPAKSKTISKYLGKEYKVVPSYGHIRDLPSKSGSVDPDNQFSMIWSVSKTGSKCLKELKTLLKRADELLLATDPDREGEAIAWHILESLKKDLKNVAVKRVTFHEITKKAILEAIASPRDIDLNLVDAYLARRALDYLFGFSLSPVLWTKLPGCKSAGRVQSVALRILTDREDEIDAFVSQEYWSLEAQCSDKKQQQFTANVIAVNGEKLSKLSIPSAEEAEKAKQAILNSDFIVGEVSEKEIKRNPLPPFTTSTLQQDASRKLNFSTKKTMQIAQKLYEGIDIQGETQALITYMRTDSVNLSQDFIGQAREYLENKYGSDFIPNKPNIYKSKVKNAQEAHEAIRPINAAISPEQLVGCIDSDLLKLYTLIWQRAIASQMVPAIYSQTKIDIASTDDKHALRAIGTRLVFKGYLKIYKDSQEAPDEDDTQNIPEVHNGDTIDIASINCAQHFTQPPARYSEAGLVKKMEELGIGRPSTYSTIIQVLQERKYATILNKAFHPELRGRIVISFLTTYFSKYLQYDFTANMEEDLDDISNAQKSKDIILDNFWQPFSTSIKDIKKISMKEVIENINTNMEKIIYGVNSEQKPRKCPKCKEGDLVLKLWSNAAFLGCSRYPDCDYKYYLLDQADSQNTEQPLSDDYPKIIGQDPETNDDIVLKFGPYGLYIELESGEDSKKKKRKRVSIPKSINENELTLEKALFLLSLPKQIGIIDDEIVYVGIGKYGPYLLYKKKFTAIKNMDDFYTMDIDKAKQILNI